MAEEKSPHTSEYSLARAVQCEEMAEKSAFPANKAILLDIAKRWRAFAAQSEQPSFQRVGRAIGIPSRR